MRLSNGSSGAILGAGGGAGAILGAGEGDLDMKNGDILLIVHNIASLRSLEITPICWGGWLSCGGGGGSAHPPKKKIFEIFFYFEIFLEFFFEIFWNFFKKFFGIFFRL